MPNTFPEIRNDKIDVAVGISSQSILLSCIWVSVWFGSGVAITILLKQLSAPQFGFEFMSTLTMIHFLCQWLFVRGVFMCTDRFGEYQRAKPEHWRSIVCVGVCTGLDIVLTNLTFGFLSLGCQTVLKNLAPLAIYVMSCLCGVEKWRASIVLVILVICLSCVLTVSDVRGSFIGVIMLIFSVFCTACRWVIVQTLHGNYKSMNQMALAQPFAAISLVPYVMIFEAPYWSSAAPLPFMGYVYAGGTVACSIVLVLSSYQITAYTSATTLAVLGNARGAFIIFFGAFMLGESEEYSIFG